MATFLKAKLTDGTEVISGFSKLKGVGQYASKVMFGAQPLNVWRPVPDMQHPSGQKVLARTRQMISGRLIESITEVEPTVEDHGYDPRNFRPRITWQSGNGGIWTCPDPAPAEGLVPGTDYPVSLTRENPRHSVVVSSNPDGTVASRYYIDGRGENGEAGSVDFGAGPRSSFEDDDEDSNEGNAWDDL